MSRVRKLFNLGTQRPAEGRLVVCVPVEQLREVYRLVNGTDLQARFEAAAIIDGWLKTYLPRQSQLMGRK